jgi:serine/threonine protein phosphatase 1
MMKFLTRRSNRAAPSAARVPSGIRIYAIGDIHGRADLLDHMSRLIAADLEASPHSGARALFLGDYIDRGLQSAEVLNRLARRDFPLPFSALRGNHEEMLLNFLKAPAQLDGWRHAGGLETLHSFGIDFREALMKRDYNTICQRLKTALPDASLAFVTSTLTSLTEGDYFFCHAGVRPGIPLDQQRAADLLWIRDDFIRSRDMFDKIIVHGHTPVEEVDVKPNRINVDTGAYLTGKLSCLVLEDDTQRTLTTSPNGMG